MLQEPQLPRLPWPRVNPVPAQQLPDFLLHPSHPRSSSGLSPPWEVCSHNRAKQLRPDRANQTRENVFPLTLSNIWGLPLAGMLGGELDTRGEVTMETVWSGARKRKRKRDVCVCQGYTTLLEASAHREMWRGRESEDTDLGFAARTSDGGKLGLSRVSGVRCIWLFQWENTGRGPNLLEPQCSHLSSGDSLGLGDGALNDVIYM